MDDTTPSEDGEGPERPTSSAKVKEKVDWILYAGDREYVDASEILETPYERERGERILRDHAEHPNGDETIQKRANAALDDLEAAKA
ncbi:hypothetical protein [Halorhabdus rudnickae]|uniref:hypothetical protein n=1 Tax=Halorhabdus rudnickae TaxID=1775544 RepID=UPI001083BF7E|nr:hypothetical protein [Halorhabdus rudnickae]